MSLLTPVQYPAKHYSHLDAGAPQISSAAGAIKAILKACLVTGYGSKASAGWAALFDDTNRMALRLPDAAQALGLPDLKIENGAGRYAVSSQSNPTSLDDATVLATVGLLAIDSKMSSVWHLIATDVGFVFCYGAGRNNYSTGAERVIFYCGVISPLSDATPISFVATEFGVDLTTGVGSTYPKGILDQSATLRDMQTNTAYTTGKSYLDVGDAAGVDITQKFSAAQKIPPFMTSLTPTLNTTVEVVTLNARSFLRWYEFPESGVGKRNFYIPTDFWEV